MSRPIKNHIGVSGGKDSTALLLWAVHESGYDPATLDFTFCDTDNEHDLTYDFVVRLSEHLQEHGIPKIKWLKPKRGFFELAKHKHRFPGARSRFCTQELKIFPTQRHVKRLVEDGFDIVLHSGVRSSESDARSKLVQREDIREHVAEYRPLLRWSINEVWAIHKRYAVEPNPLYGMGAKRVGCLPCIMSRKAEIANIAIRFPQVIDRIRAAETDSATWNKDPKLTDFHSFFTHDKIPRRFHSRKITAKDGRVMTVCTIDDVVAWATFKPDLTQQTFELNTQAEDRTSCQSTWGSCE